MNRGFVKIYRRIEDTTLWNDGEPFCKRAAWIDLILAANHKDNSFVLGMQTINIKRGQKWTSSAKLATRWNWGKRKVMSFLKLLESEGMIYLEITNRGLLITIVNYGVYQGNSKGVCTADGTANGTADGTADALQQAPQQASRMHPNKNVKNDIKNELKNVKKPAAQSKYVLEE